MTPPFSLDKPRYDQGTYFGRLRHFVDVIDPTTLFASREKVNDAMELLKAFKEDRLDKKVTDDDLWAAKKLRDACIHPDLGEPIQKPFRMSAFVPVNIPIAWGLITQESLKGQLFWQWVNQSYNVAVNYANRNASNSMSNEQILTAYVGATTASMAVAGGMSKLEARANKMSLSPSAKALVRGVVPFTAVAAAGMINVAIMRGNELSDGIEIKDSHGAVLGKSPTAGFQAVSQVAISRVVTALPVCVLPPMLEAQVLRISAIKRLTTGNKKARVGLQIVLIMVSLWSALPMAIALFPQESTMETKYLEPEFQGLKDALGQPIDKVYFNKGL